MRRRSPFASAEPENPTITVYPINLAASYVNLAMLTRRDEPEAAAQRLAKAIELLEGVLRRERAIPMCVLSLQMAHVVCAIRDQLRQFTQAAADWERALTLDSGPGRVYLATALALSLVHAGEHQKAAEQADKLVKEKLQGSELYNLACVYSLSAAAAVRDKGLPPEEQKTLPERYAGQAVELLQRAADAGFFREAKNAQALRTDPDLAPLPPRRLCVLPASLSDKPQRPLTSGGTCWAVTATCDRHFTWWVRCRKRPDARRRRTSRNSDRRLPDLPARHCRRSASWRS